MNAQIWGKYDGECMSCDFRFGTYKISGHLIYVGQSVHLQQSGATQNMSQIVT